jgi:ribosomal protein S18 acetylase RimI-like enzyme
MTSLKPSEYALREAAPEDLPFVLDLHHRTLREYIEPIWGWDKAKWDEIISNWFKPERVQLIQQHATDIGILVVEPREEELFFESISLLPDFQNKGLGSLIIQNVLRDARDSKKPVRLEVLKTNIPAQKLYLRLGFRVYETTETHLRMERGL